MTPRPPPEWTIVYHGPLTFKGRGEFLRLMLEDAGVEYENSAENLYGPTGFFDMFRGDLFEDVDHEVAPFPLLFPPAIWHRPAHGEGVIVNQVAACMVYLGENLGYAPKSAAERARADSVTLNALDYISEGRRSFHPIKDKLSYKDQKEEGDKVSKEFSKTRMPVYLHHFNKVVKKVGPQKPVAGGDHITYADFALLHVLDASVSQFNTEFYDMAWDKCEVPALKEYFVWMKDRPNLERYFKSDRCPPYAGDSMM